MTREQQDSMTRPTLATITASSSSTTQTQSQAVYAIYWDGWDGAATSAIPMIVGYADVDDGESAMVRLAADVRKTARESGWSVEGYRAFIAPPGLEAAYEVLSRGERARPYEDLV